MKLPADTLRQLLDYHYQRREKVLSFLGGIKEEEFVRSMDVGWRSIRSTLMHCLEAEDFWIQYAVQNGEKPDYDFGAYRTPGQVREKAEAVRTATMAFVDGLDEEALGRERSVTYSSGTVVRFTLAKAFLHVINHDAHHLGQVLALARQLGYEPPEIDLM